MDHTAHHADPSVPLYHLADARKALEKGYRRDIVRVIWTVGGFLRMLWTCRLYDYQSHRWLDHYGTPLTESLLTSPVPVESEPTAAAT